MLPPLILYDHSDSDSESDEEEFIYFISERTFMAWVDYFEHIIPRFIYRLFSKHED
jgi:hypothetical protein